ncbi:unnamed protein product [Acanthoscelides obtectus]|uniref:Phosphoserine phosphatase n=1 Tax=Acanthoscelides obtectus TaxID=200917 RepID=A0A9P0L5U5_ACAOB|nr:unnamed protein product [Acanthoscelides obtectus]CAK1626922.1 Phosphoserine phosphatase [Acanthoscelides obtectus]
MAEEVKAVLKNADAVCFDVDSTVIREEGIDELARFCGKYKEITELTTKAMGGGMTFQESLKMRLSILNPTRKQVDEFIRTKPATLTPNIDKLIALLQRKRIPVYLISGGFKCIIEPIAQKLNISEENVFANRMKFYFNGDYAGYDENAPTSKSGGKAVAIQHLKDTKRYKTVVLIGDGATDLEACPPADAFIGFGGNVIRHTVKERAKWFVTDFNDIINVIN